jgi:imidazolonepropionase-like amidohydrolase
MFMLVLKNARVLPELTIGCSCGLCDIVIDGGVISAVVPAGTGKGSDIIDAAGKTVLPGFIDIHVHLDLCGMNTWEENEQPDAYRVLRAVKLAQDSLKKGFTALRDLGDRNDIIIDLAQAVKDGYVEAPDIFASGVIISPTESGNEYFKGMYAESDGCDEIKKSVRKQIQRGADWIKYMSTGAVMNPGGEPGAPIYTKEEVDTLSQTAALRGKPVACHAHGTTGIMDAISAGVRTIEHASIVSEEVIKMLEGNTSSYLVPTLTPFSHWSAAAGDYPEHYIEKSQKIFELQIKSANMAYEAGLKLGFGSDAGVYVGSHGDNSYEFKVRVRRAKMKPIDTLIQATKINAEILMIEDEAGVIEAGKKANLVVIDGRPDENIDDVDNVYLVIKGGKRVCL